MSGSTIPMSRFDLMAGAKASYIEFYRLLGTSPSVKWEDLTQQRQEQWRRVIRAGIQAAKETHARKVTRRLRPLPTPRIASCGRLYRAK